MDERIQPLVPTIKRFLDASDMQPLFARFVNREDSNFVRILEWEEMFDARDTAIVEEFEGYAEEENTFTHHTYSALTSQELQAYLDRNDVEELYVCGADTDAAVLDTAYHGFNSGRDIHIVADLCDSRGGGDLHAAALTIMRRTIGQVEESDDIL